MNTETALTIDTTKHPAVVWLVNKYLPSVNGNMSQAHRELGISAKTLGGLIAGTYEGNAANQLAKLENEMNRLAARVESKQDLAHVRTGLMTRCWGAFESARRAHLANLICGKSQIGKTTAAEAYKATFSETTVFFRMPTRPTLSSVIAELMRATKQTKARTVDEGKAALIKFLSPRHVIIVDEAHLALTRPQCVDTLDLLRELYDRTGCGLTLIVTDIGAREFINGPWRERLSQIEKRGEWEIMPENPSTNDMLAIAEAYGLERPGDEILRILDAMRRTSCFGQFTHRLRIAAVEAQLHGRAITWHDFIIIHKKLSNRPA